LTAYVGIPIFLGIYGVHRAAHWKDRWAYRSEEVDLYTGIDGVLANEKPEPVNIGWKKKMQGMFT